MNKIIELETRKLKLTRELIEQTHDDSLLELIYLNSELNKEYHRFYTENPFIFIQTFNNLEKEYKENTYIDTINMKEDILISYAIYSRIRKIMYTNLKYQKQKIMNDQMANIYIAYFNEVKNYLPLENRNILKYKLSYIESEFAEYFIFKKPLPYLSIEDKLAADHLRTVECRKIQESLSKNIITKNNNFYLKSIGIFMNQLTNHDLKVILQEELNKINLSYQIETHDNIIPINKKLIKNH